MLNSYVKCSFCKNRNKNAQNYLQLPMKHTFKYILKNVI